MQYIFDPISKNITIIEGHEVFILNGPFKTRTEAIRAADEHVANIIKVGAKNATAPRQIP